MFGTLSCQSKNRTGHQDDSYHLTAAYSGFYRRLVIIHVPTHNPQAEELKIP